MVRVGERDGDGSLEGCVTVVTGASRGIGAALSRAFAEAGSDLLLVARGQVALEEAATTVATATGRRAEFISADISHPDGAALVAQTVDEAFGRVDVLVNNAHSTGDHKGRTLFELGDEVWEDVLSTNLLGPARLSRLLGSMMLKRGTGSIVNVLSGSGFLPSAAGLGPYGASKAALWALTRYLAVEGAPAVRANAICPGLVSEDGLPRNEAQSAILADVPMARIGRPEEIAGAALYLASPQSSYTTGAVITVNGGRPW